MDEGLQDEIKSTIEYELADKYTAFEIEEFITLLNAYSGSIPSNIKRIKIVASYDMGWNKRSTGRVYDSIYGHSFLIGCRSGKVISFGVRAKKCAKCSWYNKIGVTPPPIFVP